LDKATALNSNSTVTDKPDCGVTLPEALFARHLEAYPRYDIGSLKNRVTLKIEAICSSETSVISTYTFTATHRNPKQEFVLRYDTDEKKVDKFGITV
jgi:hypothetical protein